MVSNTNKPTYRKKFFLLLSYASSVCMSFTSLKYAGFSEVLLPLLWPVLDVILNCKPGMCWTDGKVEKTGNIYTSMLLLKRGSTRRLRVPSQLHVQTRPLHYISLKIKLHRFPKGSLKLNTATAIDFTNNLQRHMCCEG